VLLSSKAGQLTKFNPFCTGGSDISQPVSHCQDFAVDLSAKYAALLGPRAALALLSIVDCRNGCRLCSCYRKRLQMKTRVDSFR
jgi:hypothetical protein